MALDEIRLQVVKSTPELELKGNAAYFLDLIREMGLNPSKDLLAATYGSVLEGLLTVKEGVEAIQQLSKPTPIQGTEFEQDVLNFKVNLHLCKQSTLQTDTFGIQMSYNQFTGMLDVYVKTK